MKTNKPLIKMGEAIKLMRIITDRSSNIDYGTKIKRQRKAIKLVIEALTGETPTEEQIDRADRD